MGRFELHSLTLIEPLDSARLGMGCDHELELDHHGLDAILTQLPPSMMSEHTLPPTVHLVWKMASLYSMSS